MRIRLDEEVLAPVKEDDGVVEGAVEREGAGVRAGGVGTGAQLCVASATRIDRVPASDPESPTTDSQVWGFSRWFGIRALVGNTQRKDPRETRCLSGGYAG